jgi:putative transcriptional regulator
MNPQDDVINHVREFRRQNGDMTQQELADRVGVSRQTIFSVEKGRYNPSVGLALHLADVFGVPVEDLFEIKKGRTNG